MQVSVEKVSEIKRRLTIVVPANQVDEAYNKKIQSLAKQQIRIRGFRPGKAPISVIQTQFGRSARKEVLTEIIQSTLVQALKDEKLTPVNPPEVQPKMIAQDQDLEFTASFEILPEIEQIKFSLMDIEKPIVEITEEDTEHVINQLQKQYTAWHAVQRGAKSKDKVVIDYYAIFEGKSDIENKVTNFPLELHSETMLPGFEEGLIGTKASEEKTLDLQFPDNFAIKDRAGKPVQFIVKINQILEPEIPSFDESFVKKLGVNDGTLEGLKKQIKQSLEQERDRTVREKLKEQIFNHLLANNPIEVPDSFIAKEAKNIHDGIYKNQQHDHHQHGEDELNNFKETAKKRVTLGLLLTAYTKQNNIKIEADKVKARSQEIASLYERPEEVMGWLSSDEQRQNIEAQVLEDQVMEKLMENIPVTEKKMSYAELKGIRI